jgi:hypothetical protein
MGMIGVLDRFGESGAPWELVKEFEVSAEHICAKAKQLSDLVRRKPARPAARVAKPAEAAKPARPAKAAGKPKARKAAKPKSRPRAKKLATGPKKRGRVSGSKKRVGAKRRRR